MTFFDSLNHSLTTMASGGFSTHDASIGYYESAKVEIIISIFMFLAGVNFTLIWLVFLKEYRKAFADEEFKSYLVYMFAAISIIFVALMFSGISAGDSIRQSIFQALSIGTSTGYSSVNYMEWPVITHFVLLILMIVGACAGSTSGGLKLMRIILAFKIAALQHRRRLFI